jgi:hypothetical protein
MWFSTNQKLVVVEAVLRVFIARALFFGCGCGCARLENLTEAGHMPQNLPALRAGISPETG